MQGKKRGLLDSFYWTFGQFTLNFWTVFIGLLDREVDWKARASLIIAGFHAIFTP
jgi:hypothetical protein